MQRILQVEELKEIGIKIYTAIFNDESNIKIDGIKCPINKFASSGVRYVDLFGFRFIEQNRNKPSPWGQRAREGFNIMWIIKGRRYLVRIDDGEYIELKKP
jgi:hypothetical protein